MRRFQLSNEQNCLAEVLISPDKISINEVEGVRLPELKILPSGVVLQSRKSDLIGV